MSEAAREGRAAVRRIALCRITRVYVCRRAESKLESLVAARKPGRRGDSAGSTQRAELAIHCQSGVRCRFGTKAVINIGRSRKLRGVVAGGLCGSSRAIGEQRRTGYLRVRYLSAISVAGRFVSGRVQARRTLCWLDGQSGGGSRLSGCVLIERRYIRRHGPGIRK